ncbi:MAG TPA: cupin domain-containing protein [Longimicrobiaceae bacterium]|nr:cupin domain-containing protein [Longimicrobiaceae bacterium]
MKSLLVTAATLLAAGSAAAQNTTPAAAPTPHVAHAIVVTPATTQWLPAPPSLPPGARVAVLEGDPSQPGPFTMRIWLPDGYSIAPHVHPGNERVTVISGTFMVGMGETFDTGKLVELSAGTYSALAPGAPHFARAKGETVVQLNNMGPWGLTYVNPADDPRSAARN